MRARKPTTVYHVTLHETPSSLYLFFYHCNFSCKGCIRKLSIWDSHLGDKELSRLSEEYGRTRLKEKAFLDITELREVIEPEVTSGKAKKAVLGGGEPTTEPHLTEVIDLLAKLGLEVHLLTNGYRLSEDLINSLIDFDLKVTVSIKAISPSIHRSYTGSDVYPVKRNFSRMYQRGVDLSAETVLIPGLVEAKEVEKISLFIASLDSSIPLRIDGYIPVKDEEAPWDGATVEDLKLAVERARKYLKNVSSLHHGVELNGVVREIWPTRRRTS